MATGALRGDGLSRVQRALPALEANPQRLEFARVRFSPSPSPHTSHESQVSTRPQSLNPSNEEKQPHEETNWELIIERQASKPYDQLIAQKIDEETWLMKVDKEKIRVQPTRVNFSELSYENVKNRWKEQDIWDDEWTIPACGGMWKHERPLESEPEPESDLGAKAEVRTLPRPCFTT